MMCSFLKAVTYILFLTIFLFSSEASEQNHQIPEIFQHIRVVYSDTTQDLTEEDSQQISASSIEVLEALKAWPQTQKPRLEVLLKAAATAFGQLSLLSPYTLQFVEAPLIPYLKSGELSYKDLWPPLYKFQFGERYSRDSTDPNICQMVNGQLLECRFRIHGPVYFNKLLSEFEGDYLLIGGGTKCECEDATNRHPEKIFYSIDIDNAHLPNMVIHAGYLHHLVTLPKERFSFIWFEHCTIAELFVNKKVLDQYFRFSKPGCIFLYQSSFSLKNMEKLVEESFENFINSLKEYRFSVLEYKKSSAFRKRYIGDKISEEMEFRQLIALKPFRINTNEDTSKQESPHSTIDINLYRKPNSEEDGAALLRAKVLSRQLKFTPLSWETIDSWLTPKTEGHKDLTKDG